MTKKPTPKGKGKAVKNATRTAKPVELIIEKIHALPAKPPTDTQANLLIQPHQEPKPVKRVSKSGLVSVGQRKKLFLKTLVKALGVVSKASRMSGIARQTHFHWMATDPEYKAMVEDLKEVTLDHYEEALHDLIAARHPAAVIFALKTQGKKRGYIETVHNMNQTFDDNNVVFFMPENDRDGIQDAQVVNE